MSNSTLCINPSNFDTTAWVSPSYLRIVLPEQSVLFGGHRSLTGSQRKVSIAGAGTAGYEHLGEGTLSITVHFLREAAASWATASHASPAGIAIGNGQKKTDDREFKVEDTRGSVIISGEMRRDTVEGAVLQYKNNDRFALGDEEIWVKLHAGRWCAFISELSPVIPPVTEPCK